MALAGAGCPYIEDVPGEDGRSYSRYWAGDECQTEDGAVFDGYAYETHLDLSVQPDGLVWSGIDVKGNPIVIDGQGQRYMAGGFAFEMHGYDAETRDQIYRSGRQGDVLWEGPPVEGS